jgi:iron(III) transport system permease protein
MGRMPADDPTKPLPPRHAAGRCFVVAGIWLPALVVLVPVLVVLWRAGMPGGEEWTRISQDRLPGYLRQTLILIAGVTSLSILFGVPAAWFVSIYRFPGRKFFEVAMLLPIAMPGFIAAVAYVDAFRGLIPFYIWIRKNFGVDAFLKSQEIMPWIFATVVLASTLFPYVYLSCRAVFARQLR